MVVEVLDTLVDAETVLDNIGDLDERGDNEYVFDCLGERVRCPLLVIVGDSELEELRDGVRVFMGYGVRDPDELNVNELYGDHVFIELCVPVPETVAVILDVLELVDVIV